MDREQANEQSKKSGRGSRSLRCSTMWYSTVNCFRRFT